MRTCHHTAYMGRKHICWPERSVGKHLYLYLSFSFYVEVPCIQFTPRCPASDWALCICVCICICKCICISICICIMKYFVFKQLPGTQRGTGDKKDNQDLLPWESLAFLIEYLWKHCLSNWTTFHSTFLINIFKTLPF